MFDFSHSRAQEDAKDERGRSVQVYYIVVVIE
jgi:hypothetical protein